MFKLACVIEARMGSKRLPGKTMQFLDSKNRLIDFVILNALSSKFINKTNLILLTSNNENNFSLIKYVKKKYNIRIVAGSENNVFSRYLKIKNFGNSTLLRLTADNPFIDPLLINRFVNYFFFSGSDYLTTRAMTHSKSWKIKSDFPKGVSLEMFKSKSLYSNQNFLINDVKEFPTYFFYNKIKKEKINKFFSFGVYKQLNLKSSFTVDTYEDLKNIKKLIKKFNFFPGLNNLSSLIKYTSNSNG